MSDDNAKVISRKVEFEGWHSLETIVLQHKSRVHDGYAAPMQREMYYTGTAVVGLLYMPATDQILFNEQFRVGAWVAGDPNPWLLECCAGMIDEGEKPEEALHREADEETGCKIRDIEFIAKVYPSPGGTDEIQLLYCCRIDAAAPGAFGVEEEGEEITTCLIGATEAIRMLDAGEVTNGATVTALQWFARHHDRLKKKWGGA